VVEPLQIDLGTQPLQMPLSQRVTISSSAASCAPCVSISQ
jgi:hypothetical protein